MGFVVKRPSRMQEQSFFVFGRDGHLFLGGFEKKLGGGRNFAAGLPPPGSDTPHTLVGGVISSAYTNLTKQCAYGVGIVSKYLGTMYIIDHFNSSGG
jgi:hypothetical protein